MFVRFVKTSTLNLRVVNLHHQTETIDSSTITIDTAHFPEQHLLLYVNLLLKHFVFTT